MQNLNGFNVIVRSNQALLILDDKIQGSISQDLLYTGRRVMFYNQYLCNGWNV